MQMWDDLQGFETLCPDRPETTAIRLWRVWRWPGMAAFLIWINRQYRAA